MPRTIPAWLLWGIRGNSSLTDSFVHDPHFTSSMKKFFATLLALFAGSVKADADKLGSENDPIRLMLFADQPMKKIVASAQLGNGDGPFERIAEASKLVDEGKKPEAITRLRSVLEMPELETRLQLWVWSCLRQLGEKPDSKAAYEVLGVVLEMPLEAGCDTLAAYVDGTARYLNFSGAAIFWDRADVEIKGLCQAMVDSTIPVSGRASPRTNLSLPKRMAQVTLLTRSGNYVITAPPQSVIDPSYRLMTELMKRSKEK